jgi:hypothetical protein
LYTVQRYKLRLASNELASYWIGSGKAGRIAPSTSASRQ